MKFIGRVHWMVAAGIAGILVLLFIALSSGESPQSRAAGFMSGLAKADATKLAEYSYVPGVSKEEMKAAWEKSVSRGKYYRFWWRTMTMVIQGNDQVSVRISMVRNPGPGSFEEPYDLTLRKVDGQWLVVPGSLSREAYPFLPRF